MIAINVLAKYFDKKYKPDVERIVSKYSLMYNILEGAGGNSLVNVRIIGTDEELNDMVNSFRSMINELSNFFEGKVEELDYDLAVDIFSQVLYARGDKDKVIGILANFVSNNKKAIEIGDTIMMGTSELVSENEVNSLNKLLDCLRGEGVLV